jgi:hypothetical protein
MSTSEDARVEGGSMFIMEEARVDASLMDASSSTFSGGSISAIEGNVKIFGLTFYQEMTLRSLSGTTRGLRGFLRSAVRDFTVLMAACFALRPTLIAVSEREDLDLSEAVDGE